MSLFFKKKIWPAISPNMTKSCKKKSDILTDTDKYIKSGTLTQKINSITFCFHSIRKNVWYDPRAMIARYIEYWSLSEITLEWGKTGSYIFMVMVSYSNVDD